MGNPDAQFYLSTLYIQGLGVTQNYKEAFKWAKLSSEQGYSNAQILLGLMYSSGEGTSEDLVYAHMWSNIAGSNGNSDGIENRDNLANRMTKKQITKAQKLARECVAKNYKSC